MKKGILFGIAVLFLVSFVAAGETHYVDFSELRTQPVFLYDGDEVRFSMLGGNHVIIIQDVGSSSIKLNYGFYMDDNTELYPGLVGLDYLMRADVDKDGDVDLNVALYSISEDGQVHLVLQDVSGVDSSEVTGQVGVVDDLVSSISYKTIILVVIGIFVLGLVGFLVFRGGSNKNIPVEEAKVETTSTFETKEEKPL